MTPSYTACHDHEEFVRLDNWEIYGAAVIGGKTWRKSQADGRKDFYGHTEDGGGKRIQMLGSVAEKAAAKALGMYWPGTVDQNGRADIPPDIEVRLIGVDHYGLRVHPDDPDDWAVVGVVIEKGQERTKPYRLPGWIPASEAKRPEWEFGSGNGAGTGKVADGRPVFFVPQSELRPLDELRDREDALRAAARRR